MLTMHKEVIWRELNNFNYFCDLNYSVTITGHRLRLLYSVNNLAQTCDITNM